MDTWRQEGDAEAVEVRWLTPIACSINRLPSLYNPGLLPRDGTSDRGWTPCIDQQLRKCLFDMATGQSDEGNSAVWFQEALDLS